MAPHRAVCCNKVNANFTEPLNQITINQGINQFNNPKLCRNITAVCLYCLNNTSKPHNLKKERKKRSKQLTENSASEEFGTSVRKQTIWREINRNLLHKRSHIYLIVYNCVWLENHGPLHRCGCLFVCCCKSNCICVMPEIASQRQIKVAPCRLHVKS